MEQTRRDFIKGASIVAAGAAALAGMTSLSGCSTQELADTGATEAKHT